VGPPPEAPSIGIKESVSSELNVWSVSNTVLHSPGAALCFFPGHLLFLCVRGEPDALVKLLSPLAKSSPFGEARIGKLNTLRAERQPPSLHVLPTFRYML
jgi:hypothetical protein